MDGDVLIAEMQRVIKALLGYGARIPKELMLFTKNLVFVDGAIATLAPELDILQEISDITMYFATTHGEAIAAQIGMDPDSWELDMEGVKAGFGISEEVDRLTYRDLQERREVIRKRLEGRRLQ
jgi:ubiquinone biosynthesis protein